MKILFSNKYNLGLFNGFLSLGHECYTINRPIFDIFYENKPDIFITDDINKGILACLEEYNFKNVFDMDIVESAADTVTFNEIPKNPTIDIIIFGNHSAELDKYILPICNNKYKYFVNIFGPAGWPVAQYLGNVKNSTLSKIFNNTKLIIDLNSTGKPSDTPWNAIAIGTNCISNVVPILLKDVVPQFDGEAAMLELIEQKIKTKFNSGAKRHLAGNMYVDRARAILEQI